MKARLPILGLCLLLGVSSCTTSRPAPVALGPQVEAMPDSLPILPYLREVKRLDSLTLVNWTPLDLATLGLPAYLVPAPAGSSPRQRRQWQKAQTKNLALSGVLPAKVKNSSVATAPGAVAINKPTSAVATGSGVATDARKAGTRGGSVAVGPGAVATSTKADTPWWVYLLLLALGAASWELLSAHLVPLRWLPWRARVLSSAGRTNTGRLPVR